MQTHVRGGGLRERERKAFGFSGVDAKNRGAEWVKVHSGVD